MSAQQIEKILQNTKRSMEIEGFKISKELEETGRKILAGEIRREDYIESVKEKAWKYANEPFTGDSDGRASYLAVHNEV